MFPPEDEKSVNVTVEEDVTVTETKTHTCTKHVLLSEIIETIQCLVVDLLTFSMPFHTCPLNTDNCSLFIMVSFFYLHHFRVQYMSEHTLQQTIALAVGSQWSSW